MLYEETHSLFSKEKHWRVKLPFWLPPHMRGFSWKSSPPMAAKNFSGKRGRVLQVELGDARLMASQESVTSLPVISPPQTRSLE